MDPLSALTVATSAVQFVDFASKLISRANEIRKNGSTEDVEFLKAQTTDLIARNDFLQKSTHKAKDGTGDVDRIEKALVAAVVRCTTISNELIALLIKLTPSDRSTLKGVGKSFHMLWKKEKVENLSKRLNDCRIELNSHVLALIHARALSLQKGQNDLASEQKKILDVVTFTRSRTSATNDTAGALSQDQIIQNPSQGSALGRQTSNLEEGHPIGKVIAQYQGEDVVAVLITHEDGTSNAISITPKTTGSDLTHENQEGTNTATIFRGGHQTAHSAAASVIEYAPLARKILDSLSFPVIHVREEEIAEAHKSTFEWTFSQKHFVDFLKHESGHFWISGKAGSGKSTLMKFLYRHERTEEALRCWVNPERLVMASFYFWNAGSALQKSQEGLLRSILLEILRSRRHLIPVAFPTLCQAYLSKREIDLVSLRFTELRSALHRLLLELVERDFKICLFVDGMDEFEGDHLKICSWFHELAALPRVKLVVSSRPLNIFTIHFAKYPNIRLQDLTRQDIETYVSDNLVNNSAMTHLGASSRTKAEKFIKEIADRAEGVFLWVILSVRSLLDGLYDGDGLQELQERLDALPQELHKLYHHMLRDLTLVYRDQAAKMFLVLLNSKIQRISVSVLQLYYACEMNLESTIQAPGSPLSIEERELLYKEMDKRIKSRSRGLLEVRNGYERGSVVSFLHKSVVDFLQSDQMWMDILDCCKKSPFDPEIALLTSLLQELKSMPSETDVVCTISSTMTRAEDCLIFAQELEVKRGRAFTAVLDELNSTMSAHWRAAERFKKKSSDEWQDARGLAWPTIMLYYDTLNNNIQTDSDDPFLDLALRFDCFLYASEKACAEKMEGKPLNHILSKVVDSISTGSGDLHLNLLASMERLLQRGANPNAATRVQNLASKRRCKYVGFKSGPKTALDGDSSSSSSS
ncbi:MAG: hypothetical protein Q9165_005307 [Trypethelium subeluteriae]